MNRILIVEDDLVQGLFLKRAMVFLGYEVIGTAGIGSHAIEIATELHPDIILMDIQLGGELDGIQTATQILKKVDCFVIYITGNSDVTTINEAKKTQPSTILIKPVTGNMIEKTIDSYLSTVD